MNRQIERLLDYLVSSERTERINAWQIIFEDQYRRYYGRFRYGNKSGMGTGNDQDAEDLAQQLYLKMHQRLEKAPVEENENLKGYIGRIIKNLLYDFHATRQSELKKFVPLIDDDIPDWDESSTRSDWLAVQRAYEAQQEELENVVGRLQECQKIIDLGLRMKKPVDRILFTLNIVDNLTAKEMYCLMPFSKRSIYRRITKSISLARDKWHQVAEYLSVPSHWEQQLALSAIKGPHLGATILNIELKNLAPDAQEELIQQFDLVSINQLPKICFSALMFLPFNAFQRELRISFIAKQSINAQTLHGRPLYYIDYRPEFHNDLLYLTDRREYTGKVVDHHYDQDDILTGHIWEMKLADRVVRLYKPYHANMLDFKIGMSHQGKKLVDFVYRPDLSDFSQQA